MGKIRRGIFAYYIIECLVLSTATAVENEILADLSPEKVAELKSIIDILSKRKIESNQFEEKQKITDANFRIIFEACDKLRSLIENDYSLLSKRPQSEFEPYLALLKIFISGYENVISDKKTAELVIESISELPDSFSRLNSDIRSLITLLRIMDLLTDTNSGLASKFQEMDHVKPLNHSEIQQVLENSLEQLKRFLADSTKKMINDIIVTSGKTLFENQPNIPSYAVFNVMNCVFKLLTKNFESFEQNQKTFFRKFKSLLNDLDKLSEDLSYLEKSDRTAANIVVFLIGMRKSLQSASVELKKILKIWDEYTKDISSLCKQVIDVIEKSLQEKKDLKIFDLLQKVN
ncbi:MAG: hypothetical protein LBI95_01830 [Holosporales bacterium]|jgi:uncharacterized protein YoxC|nr:hypothetical protein [Holosporales bacterium]